MRLFKNQHQKEGFIACTFLAVLVLTILFIVLHVANNPTETPIRHDKTEIFNH